MHILLLVALFAITGAHPMDTEIEYGEELVQEHGKKKQDRHFDLLVFTQHWPYTTCLDWEEKRHGSCSRIESPARWSVHGLWPTQFHRIAPSFCNDSWPFEPSSLDSIGDLMQLYWPDVELRDQPNSLYTHEWAKHGTCAAGQLPGVDSEQDYFATGCRMAKDNPVADWLHSQGITPNDNTSYSLQQVWEAVVEGTGVRPHIDCEKIDGKVYIKEVKICYSKQLSRVDCDGIMQGGNSHTGMMGTCTRWGKFVYPSSAVPPPHTHHNRDQDESSGTSGTPPDTGSRTGQPSTGSAGTSETPTPSVSPRPDGHTGQPLTWGQIGGIATGGVAAAITTIAVATLLYRKLIRRRGGYESL